MMYKLVLLALAAVAVTEILGHGMMLEPPNRSSLWRYDDSAPKNYDDDGLFCGGMTVQWETFDGKCGVCGDRYDDPHPQDNENTGTYGTGKVVRNYTQGSVIPIHIRLTANHKGNFQYSLCQLADPKSPETGEDCFKPVLFSDGTTQYNVSPDEWEIDNSIKLPDGVTGNRCVLRWHYTAGNNWGDCGNGTFADGCGPQETFRSCADIAIL